MGDYNCLVRRHDGHHIELKTNLPIPLKGKGRYDLNFYFFSPSQLRVTKENVGTSQILSNIQTYTRFTSPALPLAAFTDASCSQSPLNRIAESLKSIGRGETPDNKVLVYELQTLVNSFRGELKSLTELLEVQIHENPGDIELFLRKVKKSIKQTRKILAELRKLFPNFLDQRVDENTRTALFWADEALGSIAVRMMLGIHNLLDTSDQKHSIIDDLESFLVEENSYRVERKYQTALEPEDQYSKELLAYRESVLKKWTQSAMYMESIESRIPKTLGHILAGLAAATAMSFALLAAFYAENLFVRNSTPWAIIIILSYVFKDRIKEILREILGRLLPKLAADKIYKFLEPREKKKAGVSQVIVRFCRETDISNKIRAIRDAGRNPFYSILPPQNILHYHRYISINSRMIRSIHSRHDAITEITRIRMDNFLKEMDDPENISYKLEEGKRKKVKGARVYHIHLVVVLKEDSKKAPGRIFHYCLVLNQDGIIRVEKK